MKVLDTPRSGRIGNIIYSQTKYGLVAREYRPPSNPRSQAQQRNRANFAAASRRWRLLSPEQRNAWAADAASRYVSSASGRPVKLNGYSRFVSVNNKRAFLGLPWYDLPPQQPAIPANPVTELVITNTAGNISIKLRLTGLPAEHTLLQGAAPVSSGVSFVQHFPFLDLLPLATDGLSDVTALYVARYGVPAVGEVIFLRTCQHVDGWTDVPKVVSAQVPGSSP
jgi:hypothetical protein